MTLSKSVLTDNLKAFAAPRESTTESIAEFGKAYTNYMYDAEVLSVSVTSESLSGAKAALIASLSSPGAVPGSFASVQAAIAAFWTVLIAGSAEVWAGVAPPLSGLGTPPPGLAGLSTALNVAGVYNMVDKASPNLAAERIASVIHDASQGGLVADTTSPTPIVHEVS